MWSIWNQPQNSKLWTHYPGPSTTTCYKDLKEDRKHWEKKDISLPETNETVELK